MSGNHRSVVGGFTSQRVNNAQCVFVMPWRHHARTHNKNNIFHGNLIITSSHCILGLSALTLLVLKPDILGEWGNTATADVIAFLCHLVISSHGADCGINKPYCPFQAVLWTRWSDDLRLSWFLSVLCESAGGPTGKDEPDMQVHTVNVTSHEHHGLLNGRRLLVNWKKIKAPHHWPMDSPHKAPARQEAYS